MSECPLGVFLLTSDGTTGWHRGGLFQEWVDRLFSGDYTRPAALDVLGGASGTDHSTEYSHGDLAADFIGTLFQDFRGIARGRPSLEVERVICDLVQRPDWADTAIAPTVDFDRVARLLSAVRVLHVKWAVSQAYGVNSNAEWKDVETSLFLWWEVFVFGGFRDKSPPVGNGASARSGSWVAKVNDVILEVLRTTLDSDHRFPQYCALHGLNHLSHPESESVVLEHIRLYREKLTDWGLLDYARACASATAE